MRPKKPNEPIYLVVDRYAIPEEWDDAQRGRLSDSVQLAFLGRTW